MVSALDRARAARALLEARCLAEGARSAHAALAASLDALATDARAEAVRLLADPLPLLERDVCRADVERAERALALLEGLEAPAVQQRQRLVAMVLGGALVVLALGLALWPAPAIEASASASYGVVPSQGPGAVLDGDPATNWLLPDRTEGWLELRFRAPRAVTAVEIANGRNAPYDDRAAREVEVVLLGARGDVLASGRAELELGEPSRRVEVAADGVARVRVYVRSWHRAGGALDEVRALP